MTKKQAEMLMGEIRSKRGFEATNKTHGKDGQRGKKRVRRHSSSMKIRLFSFKT